MSICLCSDPSVLRITPKKSHFTKLFSLLLRLGLFHLLTGSHHMFYKGLDCLHLWILSPAEVLSPLTPALGELFELFPVCANLFFFFMQSSWDDKSTRGWVCCTKRFSCCTHGSSANGFVSLKEHSPSFHISFCCVICVKMGCSANLCVFFGTFGRRSSVK